VSKFAISHLGDIDVSQTPGLLPVDGWMIERVNETAASAAGMMNAYEIGAARHEIDVLFWRDFCDNYIEIIKSRLYEPDIQGVESKRSGQYALYYTLLNLLRMYAVFVPHITEYLYREFFLRFEKTVSIHLTKWPAPSAIDAGLIVFGENLKTVMFNMRKYKTERNLSMRSDMETLDIHTEQPFAEWFRQTEQDLRACTRAKIVNIHVVS